MLLLLGRVLHLFELVDTRLASYTVSHKLFVRARLQRSHEAAVVRVEVRVSVERCLLCLAPRFKRLVPLCQFKNVLLVLLELSLALTVLRSELVQLLRLLGNLASLVHDSVRLVCERTVQVVVCHEQQGVPCLDVPVLLGGSGTIDVLFCDIQRGRAALHNLACGGDTIERLVHALGNVLCADTGANALHLHAFNVRVLLLQTTRFITVRVLRCAVFVEVHRLLVRRVERHPLLVGIALRHRALAGFVAITLACQRGVYTLLHRELVLRVRQCFLHAVDVLLDLGAVLVAVTCLVQLTV